MDVIEALNARFSCRAFKTQPLDRAILLKILTATERSPNTPRQVAATICRILPVGKP